MRLGVEQPPGTRERHMIRRRFVETVAEETTQRQGVGDAPSDAALGVYAFEEADQLQSKVDSRRQRRPSQPVVVERPTALFAEAVEVGCIQRFVESFVERMSRCFG